MTKLPKLIPCKKCGSTDIEISNCGYSSFNVGSAKCKCGNEIELMGIYWDFKGNIQVAKEWNFKQTTEVYEIKLVSKSQDFESFGNYLRNCLENLKAQIESDTGETFNICLNERKID